MSAPSSDAGCYESHWHYPARSSSGRAGNPGNGGSDSGNLSSRCHDSRSRRRGDRLTERRQTQSVNMGRSRANRADQLTKTEMVFFFSSRLLHPEMKSVYQLATVQYPAGKPWIPPFMRMPTDRGCCRQLTCGCWPSYTGLAWNIAINGLLLAWKGLICLRQCLGGCDGSKTSLWKPRARVFH